MGTQNLDYRTRKSAREEITKCFGRAFSDATFVPALPITSGADSSVHLIGSSISTLKPWLGSELPPSGLAAFQPAVRTQNLSTLGDGKTKFSWGGYFTNFSLVQPIDTTVGLVEQTLAFFLDECGFAPQDVLIRATNANPELARLAAHCERHVRVAWDDHDPNYYKHKIGIQTVVGDNFNVALRHPITDRFDDVGNYIHFSDGGTGQIFDDFVEVGFGDTTILRAKMGLHHVLDAFDFPHRLLETEWEQRHLEDAVLTGLVLWSEGLRPSNRNARAKLLRKYVEAGQRIIARNNLSSDEVAAWVGALARNEGLPSEDGRSFAARLKVS